MKVQLLKSAKIAEKGSKKSVMTLAGQTVDIADTLAKQLVKDGIAKSIKG